MISGIKGKSIENTALLTSCWTFLPLGKDISTSLNFEELLLHFHEVGEGEGEDDDDES